MSGKLFQKDEIPTVPIRADLAVYVQKAIVKELLDKYPDLEQLCIGSVGKKKDDDFNGDIDIAIKVKDYDELLNIIYEVFSYSSIVESKSLYIVSIKYPYKDIFDNNIIKYVAVDFIQSADINYTAFRYFCPDYRNNESKYKVGAKIMYANSILNHCKERFEGVDKNRLSSLSFNPLGLYKCISKINSNGLIQFEKEKFLTNIPAEIVGMCFKDSDVSRFNSIETLWDSIHSDAYKYPEEVKSLEVSLFANSYRKYWDGVINPEDFKLTYWTSEQIHYIIDKKYAKERQINEYIDYLVDKNKART